MLIQKIRTIHRQLPATTGGGADQVVRRISTPSASSALILSTTRSGVDKQHHCRAHGQFLESPIWISIRCSWFFGGGSFFSSSSDLFVSYIEPFSAGVDSDSIPFQVEKRRKEKSQVSLVALPPAHHEALSELQEVHQGWSSKNVKEKNRQLSITQVDQIKAFVKAAKLGDWWENFFQQTFLETPWTLSGLFSTRWARTSTGRSSWTFSVKSASDLSTKLWSPMKTMTQVEEKSFCCQITWQDLFFNMIR